MRIPRDPGYAGLEHRPPRIIGPAGSATVATDMSPRRAIIPVLVLTLIFGLFSIEATAVIQSSSHSPTSAGRDRLTDAVLTIATRPQAIIAADVSQLTVAALSPPKLASHIDTSPTGTDASRRTETAFLVPLAPKPAAPKSTLAPEPAIDHEMLRRNRLRHRIHFKTTTPEVCLPHSLIGIIYDLAEEFGEVRIHSTHRSHRHNVRVGGARQSFHLQCRAIDFTVVRGPSNLFKRLRARPEVGGLKKYSSGFFHIDNGPKRTW